MMLTQALWALMARRVFLCVDRARWQSGHAAACKAVDAGSIPTLASNRHFLKAYFLDEKSRVGRKLSVVTWLKTGSFGCARVVQI
jgi:hypothetical protein